MENSQKSEVRSQKPEIGTQYSVLSTQCAGTPRAACRRRFSIFNSRFSIFNRRTSARSTGFSRNHAPPKGGTTSARSGLSLIEVLASVGVLSIGILGLAALLPVGQVTIFEAIKADRAGACGRAAMRDVIVRRMLDYHNWYDSYQKKFVYDPKYNNNRPWYDQNGNPTAFLGRGLGALPGSAPASFVIDPLGATSLSMTNSTLGNSLTVSGTPTSWLTGVPRISLAFVNSSGGTTAYTNPVAASVFRAADDLTMPLPENMSPPQAPGRPIPLWNSSANVIQSQGDYTWFAMVTPTPNNPVRFTVSVVICYRRVLNANAEQAVPVGSFYDGIQETTKGPFVAQGGGSVLLKGPIGGANGINVRENDWVALTNTGPLTPTYGKCSWYRVVAIADNTTETGGQIANPTQLTLSGPDWQYSVANGSTTSGNMLAPGNMLLALGQDVVGVYTTTVDLDTDPTWKN
jgi:hypothetical protein